MNIRWTKKALAQWSAAYDFVFEDNPAAAQRQAEIVVRAVEQLSDFPEIGRPGRVAGTREMVVQSTPYIVAYRLQAKTVYVVALLHSARRWPARF